MSSIAYVTDNKILEFHRINGNKSMNFYRFSNQNFTDFSLGDLMFFLTKERNKQKEKTIVGYGRCKAINNYSIKQAWNKYGVLNGFKTYEEFASDVNNNSEKKIKQINCIYLEDVVFFQNSIYLSDFGIKIDPQLSSYTYLDKNDDITSKILENGIVDIWSVALGKTNENVIQTSKTLHDLISVMEKINSLILNKSNTIKAYNLLDSLIDFNKLRENGFEYYKLEEDKVIIALPFVFNSKNHDERLKSLLGHMILIKHYLKFENINVQFKVVSNRKIDDIDMNILKEINK